MPAQETRFDSLDFEFDVCRVAGAERNENMTANENLEAKSKQSQLSVPRRQWDGSILTTSKVKCQLFQSRKPGKEKSCQSKTGSFILGRKERRRRKHFRHNAKRRSSQESFVPSSQDSSQHPATNASISRHQHHQRLIVETVGTDESDDEDELPDTNAILQASQQSIHGRLWWEDHRNEWILTPLPLHVFQSHRRQMLLWALLGYDNYIYIEYIGRKMSFEVSVEKLFKRESISDQHD